MASNNFDPTSLIPFGLGAIGSLFDGKRKPSAYEQQQAALAQEQGNLASTEQGYGSAAYGNYQKADNQAQRQVGDYADYLRQDPFTDQATTSQLGAMTSGLARDTQASKANLAASLAQNGISPDSSAGIGGLASIANGSNANLANARLQIYNNQQSDRANRMAALTNLLSGNASNYSNLAQGWNGAAAGNLGSAAGQYGQLAAQDTARQNYNDQQGANTFGGLAQLGGALYAGMQPAPAPTHPTPHLDMINNTYTAGNSQPSYYGGSAMPVTPATGVAPVYAKRAINF